MCEDKRAKLPRVLLHLDAGAAGPHRGESVLVRGVGIERSGAAGLPAYLAELAQDFVAVYLGPRCAVLTGAIYANRVHASPDASTQAHVQQHTSPHTNAQALCISHKSCRIVRMVRMLSLLRLTGTVGVPLHVSSSA